MKCGGKFEEESCCLLKAQRSEELQRAKVSFPMLFLLSTLLGYTSALSFSCFWDRSKSCVPEIAKLPLQRPYLFQSCMLLACYFGVMTLVTFSPVSWQHLPPKSIVPRLGKWVSQVSGLASMAVLLLISMAPSELKEAQKPELLTQEGILISLYFVLATTHAYSATYIRELGHQHEVVTRPSLWRWIRLWLTRILVVSTLIFLVMLGKKQFIPISTHSGLQKYLGHLLFLCSFLYIATYHEDLGSLEVSLQHASRVTL